MSCFCIGKSRSPMRKPPTQAPSFKIASSLSTAAESTAESSLFRSNGTPPLSQVTESQLKTQPQTNDSNLSSQVSASRDPWKRTKRWELSGEQEVRRSSTSPVFSGLVLKEPKNLVGKTIWVKRVKVDTNLPANVLARKIATEIESKYVRLKHTNLLRYRGSVFDAVTQTLEIYTDAADHFGNAFFSRKSEGALIKYVRDLLRGIKFLRDNEVSRVGNIEFRNTVFDLEDNIKLAWFAENDQIAKIQQARKQGRGGPAVGDSNDLLAVKRVITEIFLVQIPRHPEWPRFLQKLVTESCQPMPNLDELLNHELFSEQPEGTPEVSSFYDKPLRKTNTMNANHQLARNGQPDPILEESESEEESPEEEEERPDNTNAFMDGLRKLFTSELEQDPQKLLMKRQRDKAIKRFLRKTSKGDPKSSRFSPGFNTSSSLRLQSFEDGPKLHNLSIITPSEENFELAASRARSRCPPSGFPSTQDDSLTSRPRRLKSIDDTLISNRFSNDDISRFKNGFLSPYTVRTSIRQFDRSKIRKQVFDFNTRAEKRELTIVKLPTMISYVPPPKPAPGPRAASTTSLTPEFPSPNSARPRWRPKNSHLLVDRTDPLLLELTASYHSLSNSLRFKFL